MQPALRSISPPIPAVPPHAVRLEPSAAPWHRDCTPSTAVTLQIVGETLAESADIRAGEYVLDVAAGIGNATLAAARRFAHVTSVDRDAAPLRQGAARLSAEGLRAVFEVAEADALPYGDGSFDVALSVFAAMDAPAHRRMADELLRVVRPGGRIGVCGWAPTGFLGELSNAIAAHVASAEAIGSPTPWGNDAYVSSWLGSRIADLRCQRRIFNLRYATSEHWMQGFGREYPPMRDAFAVLDHEGRRALTSAVGGLLKRWNIGGAHSLVVPAEYLEVVAVVV